MKELQQKTMDRLQECAKAFEQLLDKKYHIVIGRKGKSVDFELEFEHTDFHHLAGLHKLKDLNISKENREKAFWDILSGNIHLSDIKESAFFSKIEKRMKTLIYLESILDDNRTIFKYNKNITYSLIQADYLLSTPYQNTDIYTFISLKEDYNHYFCRSFFPKDNTDYTRGQPTYTLLLKEKITISTGEKEILYDRLTPLNNLSTLSKAPESKNIPAAEPKENQ